MRTFTLLAITFSIIGLSLCAQANPDRAQRVVAIDAQMHKQLDRLNVRLAKPNASITQRDLPNGALASLAVGEDPRIVEAMLRRAFADQVMDEQSKVFGKLPWEIGNSEVNDDNAIEFGTQSVGPILLGYGGKLSPDLISWIKPHIVASFAALRRHKVKVSYTNIFLMKATSLILLGQAIGDTQAQADGVAMLDSWLTYTREYGIHEFDSPTYYATDLDSLVLGYKFAASPSVRARYKTVLDLLWSDIAANFFAGRGSLSGPHSRDYDFINGMGGLNAYMYAEGLRSSLSDSDCSLETSTLLECLSGNSYHPSSQILDLAAVPERIVRSRWDSVGHDRYNYITPDFSIGSTSGDSGAQDKMIDIEMASATPLPAITVVQDNFDSPYGTVRVRERSGHNKPFHLPSHPVCVQSKGALLVLLDTAPAKPLETSSLATNILLPAKAGEIRVDGVPIATSAPFEQILSPGSIVSVKEGNAAIAIRIVSATSTSGQPVIKLEGDAVGLKHGVIRLAIYQYNGPSTTIPTTPLPACLLIVVDRATGDGDLAALLEQVSKASAKPISETDAGTFGYRVTIGSTTFEAAMSLKNHQPSTRTIDGADLISPVLSVNGVDLATPILDSLAAS